MTIGAEGRTCSGWWGYAQGGQECQGLRATGGWFAAYMVSAGVVGSVDSEEAVGLAESAEPMEATG